MGKTKSAVYFVLITIVLAVLCAWCSVSFPAGIYSVNSVISAIDRDAVLGGTYTVVYYPEGVISAEDYEANLLGESDPDEYKAKYQSYGTGAIYLEKESVLDGDKISAEFIDSFNRNVTAIRARFEAYGLEGTRVEVADDYTIRATVPDFIWDKLDQTQKDQSESFDVMGSLFAKMALTGAPTVAYSNETIIENSDEMKYVDYVSGVSYQYANDTAIVVISFTDKGRALIKEKTAGATSSSTATLQFKIGDESAIELTVTEVLDQPALYINGGGLTSRTAPVIALVLNDAIHGTNTDLALTTGVLQTLPSTNGDNTMLFIYIGLGALMLASAIYFFVRYHKLGAAHLYGYLTYAVGMVICVSFIPFLNLGVAGVAAIVATSLLLCVSNAVAFEYAKKEFALGKTMTSSVKTGYKKCFWHLFDLHVALAIASILVFAIALTELQTFAFIFFLGVVFSGVCSLGLTRFYWYLMMGMWKKKDGFCNFARNEEDEDDD